VIKRMLKTLGYNENYTATANNGKEALEIMKMKVIDIILMDVMMPEMSGLEVTAEIRKMKELIQPTIIAVTANAFDEIKRQCFESGMKEFLTKPINKKDLDQTLKKYWKVNEFIQNNYQ